MASSFVWLFILGVDAFSVLLGSYAAVKFVKAYLDNGDLFRYQKYLVTAFFLILVVPLLFTVIALKLSAAQPTSGLTISFESERSSADGLLLVPGVASTGSFDVYVKNPFPDDKTLTIDIACADLSACQPDGGFFLLPAQVKVPSGIVIHVPIRIREQAVSGNYSLSVSLRYRNGTVYSSLPLDISIR